MRDHQFCHRLGGEESAFEIDIHGEVKILFAHVLGEILGAEPDIVDQYVDTTEMLVGFGDACANAIQIGEVHTHSKRTAAQGFNLFDQCFIFWRGSDANNNICPCPGTGQRAGTPDAARCPCDKNNTVCEAKIRCNICGHNHLH